MRVKAVCECGMWNVELRSNHRLSACCRLAGASIKTKEIISRTSCDVELFNYEL